MAFDPNDAGRAAASAVAGVGGTRERLLESPLALVEDLRRAGRSPEPAREDYSPDFQVCPPYRGLFVWRVGRDEVVGDASRIVFVRGDEGSRVFGPLADGYAELVLTPHPEVLAELAHANGTPLGSHPLFRGRSRRADPTFQLLRAGCHARLAGRRWSDPLEAEELALGLLRAALRGGGPPRAPVGAATARLVRRAKEFLAAELPNRIRLGDVARVAGASPSYLTDVFRRSQGVSLHRYLVQLRLARALHELPDAADLTRLALDLGFSSHSHFSAAFRRAFGTTPSAFRRGSRAGG